MTMHWYYWDTNIGQAIACATSAHVAREQLLATLPDGDAAKGELAGALKARPQVKVGQPCALVAWHQ